MIINTLLRPMAACSEWLLLQDPTSVCVCFVGLCVCVFSWCVLSAFSVFPWQAVLIGWPWGKAISCLAPNQHASLIPYLVPPPLCVVVCVGRNERVSEEGLCVQAFLLFLLKCASSCWRRLIRYDITALCFIFKRWAGSPHFPLMRPRHPQNIWKVYQRASYVFACEQRAKVCGGASSFSLTNTHFTHNPWRFLSWSHVSDLIGYCINNTRTLLLTPLPTAVDHVVLLWHIRSVFQHKHWLSLNWVLFTHLPPVLFW